MKKSILFFSLLILICASAHATLENPVSWTFEAKKLGPKVYELHIKARIDPFWHLYAQDAGEKLMNTLISFTPNPIIKPEGKIIESGTLKKENDQNLKLTLNYYYNQVDFVQKLNLRSPVNTTVKGMVTYVVCNDKDGKCLPTKKVPFSILIAGNDVVSPRLVIR